MCSGPFFPIINIFQSSLASNNLELKKPTSLIKTRSGYFYYILRFFIFFNVVVIQMLLTFIYLKSLLSFILSFYT